jgi:6-methylsalicylate decarboxylase
MRIDVHAHYYPEKYIAYVSRLRGETNYRIRAPGAAVILEQRVDLLNQSGIRVQILSVGAQQPYSTNAQEAISAAKLGNDLYAEVCAQHGGHFAAIAALPLPHVDAALAELTRALDDLGMVGVSLGCSIVGRPLDEAAFEPMFAELDRRGAVLFLHPVGRGCGSLLGRLRLEFSPGSAFRRYRCRAPIDFGGHRRPLSKAPHYRASPRRHPAVFARTPRRLAGRAHPVQAQRVLETVVV